MIKYVFLFIVTLFFLNYKIYAETFPVYVNNLTDAIVEADNTKQDILVIFTAEWCKYCQIMKGDLIDSQHLLGDTLICYIDIEENPELKEEYKVKMIPDYFILRKRKEVKRKKGYKNFEDFIKWFKNE